MATCHFGDVAGCKKLYLEASWQCLAGLVSLLGADAECDFLVSATTSHGIHKFWAMRDF